MFVKNQTERDIMKLKNIEILLKRAKGIPYELKERNRVIGKITSFGYQVVSSETADRIFNALSVALDERQLLTKLEKDIRSAFVTLDEDQRKILNLTCCKELTMRDASDKLNRPLNEVRAGYRRAMRDMSKRLIAEGYDDFDIGMFIEMVNAG